MAEIAITKVQGATARMSSCLLVSKVKSAKLWALSASWSVSRPKRAAVKNIAIAIYRRYRPGSTDYRTANTRTSDGPGQYRLC